MKKLKLVEKEEIKELPVNVAEARLVPISEILAVPGDNVREEYDPESIDSLAASLKTKGQLQSILIRTLDEPGPNGERYKLVAGYRRYLAAKQSGVESLFAIIREYSDPDLASAANAAENLEREDVPLYSYCRRLKEFVDKGWPVEKIVHETGISLELCTRLVELVTEVAPELLAKLKYDESAKMIARLQWISKHIKGYSQEDKFKRQIEWWEREGWKELEEKKERKAHSASPEKIAELAERIRSARGIVDEKGKWIPLSEEQSSAVANALMWCAAPRRRKAPL